MAYGILKEEIWLDIERNSWGYKPPELQDTGYLSQKLRPLPNEAGPCFWYAILELYTSCKDRFLAVYLQLFLTKYILT